MTPARVLVTGAAGQLGGYLMRRLGEAGHEAIGTAHSSSTDDFLLVDIADRDSVAKAFGQVRPDVVIHAAAYTDVDGCERDPDRADAVNHIGARNVAQLAVETGAWAIGVSTDFVFGQGADAPFAEDAEPAPMSAYGRSKRDGELAFLAGSPAFAIARTAWVYGGAGKHFPRTVLGMLAKNGTMDVVTDEVGNPTYADDLAGALIELIGQRPNGVFHLVNEGAVSRYDLARAVAMHAGLDPESIRPTTAEAFQKVYPLPATRPSDSGLINQRAADLGVRLAPWDDALARYIPQLAGELSMAQGNAPKG